MKIKTKREERAKRDNIVRKVGKAVRNKRNGQDERKNKREFKDIHRKRDIMREKEGWRICEKSKAT